jgi:hypothetical protein
LNSLALVLQQNKLAADGFVASSPPGMHLRQYVAAICSASCFRCLLLRSFNPLC